MQENLPEQAPLDIDPDDALLNPDDVETLPYDSTVEGLADEEPEQ